MRERAERTIEERANYLEQRRREKNYVNHISVATVVIGIVLFIIGISVFHSSSTNESVPSMELEDMHLLTSIEITEIEEELIGKSNYVYYAYAKKQGSTYKFQLTEEIYDMVKRHRESNEDARYDVMFSQGIYAEKTAVGISLTE